MAPRTALECPHEGPSVVQIESASALIVAGHAANVFLFTLKMALQKRKEQLLDTQALFVDLKKALGSPPIYSRLANKGDEESKPERRRRRVS